MQKLVSAYSLSLSLKYIVSARRSEIYELSPFQPAGLQRIAGRVVSATVHLFIRACRQLAPRLDVEPVKYMI
jgi:hypothetical protein